MARPPVRTDSQDFRQLTFTLAPGEEKSLIGTGCRYLTIYRLTLGASLEIKEKIDNWEGNWCPLLYGFSVGFTSERGVAFRNPGTASATYTVLYGRGPFADNRFIQDPTSFGGGLQQSQTNPAAGMARYIPLGFEDQPVGNEWWGPGPGTNPVTVAPPAGKTLFVRRLRIKIWIAVSDQWKCQERTPGNTVVTTLGSFMNQGGEGTGGGSMQYFNLENYYLTAPDNFLYFYEFGGSSGGWSETSEFYYF